MTAFIIGAALGVVQLVWSLLRRPIYGRFGPFGDHPFQGLIAAAALGALVYGSLLWIAAALLFGR